MKKRKYLDKEAEICAAYVAGVRQCELVRRFGIPQGSINTILKRCGVRRSRAASIRQRVIAAFDPALRARDIAAVVDCDPNYVNKIARECGLRECARTAPQGEWR